MLLVVFLFTIFFMPDSNLFAQTPTHNGLTYDAAGGKKLDLYIPTTGTGPYPVVLWIFGGAWMAGSRNDQFPKDLFSMLGPKGIAVASMDYSYSSAAKWPTQSQQCRAVVRWLRANATKYNLDPDNIGAAGMSAGGHLAAFLGTSNGVKTATSGSVTMDLEGAIGGNTEYSSKVQAVYDMYGPANFLTMGNSCNGKTSNMDHMGASSPEGMLIGGAIQQNQDKAKLASPTFFVSEDDPPFLIQHGAQDLTVISCQSIELDSLLGKAFAANKKEHKLYLPNQGHGFAATVNKDTVISFFVRNLLKPKTAIHISTTNQAKSASIVSVSGTQLTLFIQEAVSLTVFNVNGSVVTRTRLLPQNTFELNSFGSGLKLCKLETQSGDKFNVNILCP